MAFWDLSHMFLMNKGGLLAPRGSGSVLKSVYKKEKETSDRMTNYKISSVRAAL